MMKKLFITLTLVFITTCALAEEAVYSLYRTGVDLLANVQDETLRFHVATFDAKSSDANYDANYNLANCEFAQELFNANQPHFRGSIYDGIKIKYWCEKGRFRK